MILKTYLKNAGKPFGCQPLLANGSGQNLPNVKNLQASGFLDSNANEVPYDMTGVLEDTCWQDLKDSAGVEKSKKPKARGNDDNRREG